MPSDSINKLTRMFQDIQTSDDMNKSMKEVLGTDLLNVKVGSFLVLEIYFLRFYPAVLG